MGADIRTQLDKLDPAVSHWRGCENHDEYVKNLRKQHACKHSFWPRYET